jgi:hypothetical protein
MLASVPTTGFGALGQVCVLTGLDQGLGRLVAGDTVDQLHPLDAVLLGLVGRGEVGDDRSACLGAEAGDLTDVLGVLVPAGEELDTVLSQVRGRIEICPDIVTGDQLLLLGQPQALLTFGRDHVEVVRQHTK